MGRIPSAEAASGYSRALATALLATQSGLCGSWCRGRPTPGGERGVPARHSDAQPPPTQGRSGHPAPSASHRPPAQLVLSAAPYASAPHFDVQRTLLLP